MSIGAQQPAKESGDDCLAQIDAVLPTLSCSQLRALKSKVDAMVAKMFASFLGLPTEIRLAIYAKYFELIDETIRVERLVEEYDYPEDESSVVIGIHGCTNILEVCRSIAKEARPLLQSAIEQRKVRFCLAERRVPVAINKYLRSPHSMLSSVKTVEIPSDLHGPWTEIMTRMEGLEGRDIHVVCPRVMVSTSDNDGSALKLEYALFQKYLGNRYDILEPTSQLEDLDFSKAFPTVLRRSHIYG
ncbi:uncharacterized protein AB675_7412 [Cyphellophora attinorum]|uniref:Uncharacterized protein n=1 Tax=Cyphellophora attinorum TaxID=1664694 RepID=A0A0N1GWX6_9EURO|nr:uncharacterized protein AB675_7412 [Phialophora attinorum]KPI34550.1 hypothetical protein AB675_7412 [Phialophora attinorum]